MKRIEELEKEIELLKSELEKQQNRQLPTAGQKVLGDAGTGGDEHIAAIEKDVLSRSQLWSSISHAIITPMDAILGMTDLVLDTELTDEQRNYVEMINASADRLLGVVSDVIDYSELVEEKLRQDLCNFNLFDILEYDLYIAKLSAKHQDLGFSSSIAKEIPRYINSDPGRIKQVLNTLMSNAIQYTKKGHVRVTVESAGYDVSRRLFLKFTVEDTGPGISPEIREKLFQTPPSLNITGGEDKYSEVGLGLVVAAKLVQLFGGEIGVEGKEGGGATFWFTWPVIDSAATYMGELPQDMFSEKGDGSQVLQGARVLLADDEHINASITKAVLEQAGVNVTVVNNGKKAVEALEKDCYQAVLMDVQMPEMDGIKATHEIRRREKKKGIRTPIIALTAHALHRDRERCLQAGMDDYLPKPLDKGHLLDMLIRYITRKALIVGSDPVNQQEILQPLVEKGWAVTIAETCRLAMYEASLTHFDLVIIDISIPTDDGVETVMTIRELEVFSGSRSTILGVGFVDAKDTERYEDKGIDEFFAKTEMTSKFKDKVVAMR